MADFVELNDGTILNLDHVIRMHPPTLANKLETIYGASYTFADEEGDHVREAIRSKIAKPTSQQIEEAMRSNIVEEVQKPKPKGRPKSRPGNARAAADEA